MRFRSRPLLAATLLASALAVRIPAAGAAAPDNNVEWAGVSHLAFQDRRPLCPVGGESFEVRFQTWRNDLTSASVHVVAGAGSTDVPASRIATRGPYDVWSALVPATASGTESYWIALTDGSLTDYLSVSGLSHTVPADGGWTLDFNTLAHAPAGATPVTGGGAVFKVWAPTVGSAQVRGDFNGWTGVNPMSKVGEYFIARVNTVADRANYKFWFPTQPNNSGYVPDPRARGLNAGSSYNSIVENPFRYAWGDSNWAMPAADSLVIYQLHVGTFCGLNDPVGATGTPSTYRDVAARVGHLRDLGVNAVQLNPVTEFPGDFSAGYNPITQFSPEWKYGTPDDFKYMVDTFHRNGIAVLLDIVWNHFSPTDNFLWNFDGTQQWFETPDVQTAWGSQAAFGKTAVADYFANSAQSWFGEYHLDGFRMDATSAMTQGVHSASGWALMQRLANEKANRWADKFTIAEQLPSNSAYTTPTSAGGAGFDAQYSGPFRDGIRGAINDAAFGDPNMNGVRGAILGSAPYLTGVHALNYVQLHDEAWPSSGGQRWVKTIDPVAPNDDAFAKGRTKLAEGIVLTAPGVPEMLQGDEWLESIDWGPNTVNRIDWSKKTTYAGIYRYYRTLIGWRRRLSALRASSSTHVFHVDEANNVIAFRRYDASGNTVVVIANFSNTDRVNERIGIPVAGGWEEIVNSQDPQFEGAGPVNAGALATDPTTADGFTQSLVLQIPKMALIVLAPQSTVGVAPGAVAPLRLALDSPAPNPSPGGTRLSFTLPARAHVTLALFDLGGRRVRTLLDADRDAGGHALAWDGRDDTGRPVAAGLYFARLSAGGEARVTRITHLE